MLNLDLLIYGMALKSPNGELSLEIVIFFLHLSDWRTILTKFLEVIIRLQVQFGIYLHEWVFQKVSKFYEAAGRVKFELSEKLASANQFQIERKKPYDYKLLTYTKKFNGWSVTRSKGSCLLCWMFGNFLENLGKTTRECKNKHSDKFPNLRIFRNLRKSAENFGNCRLKITFQHFLFFFKSSEIVGSLSEIFGIFRKNPKMSESFRSDLPTIFVNFRKCRNSRKCSENFRNPQKITLFALVLHFLHWCYSLATLLSTNQNRVIFPCMLLGVLLSSDTSEI